LKNELKEDCFEAATGKGRTDTLPALRQLSDNPPYFPGCDQAEKGGNLPDAKSKR